MVSLGGIVWSLYEDRIREQFSNHPNGEELITKMKAGELSIEEVDIAFSEAESYAMKKMTERFKTVAPDSNGNVTFQVISKD